MTRTKFKIVVSCKWSCTAATMHCSTITETIGIETLCELIATRHAICFNDTLLQNSPVMCYVVIPLGRYHEMSLQYFGTLVPVLIYIPLSSCTWAFKRFPSNSTCKCIHPSMYSKFFIIIHFVTNVKVNY